MKHNYNDNDDFYKEDKRVSNNISQLRRNINQAKFGPQKQKRNQRGRMLPLNAVNLPGKDPTVGINGFEGTGLEQLMPRQKPFFLLWKRVRF